MLIHSIDIITQLYAAVCRHVWSQSFVWFKKISTTSQIFFIHLNFILFATRNDLFTVINLMPLRQTNTLCHCYVYKVYTSLTSSFLYTSWQVHVHPHDLIVFLIKSAIRRSWRCWNCSQCPQTATTKAPCAVYARSPMPQLIYFSSMGSLWVSQIFPRSVHWFTWKSGAHLTSPGRL